MGSGLMAGAASMLAAAAGLGAAGFGLPAAGLAGAGLATAALAVAIRRNRRDRRRRTWPVLTELLDILPDGHLVLDGNGAEVLANAAARGLLGADGPVTLSLLRRRLGGSDGFVTLLRGIAAGQPAEAVVWLAEAGKRRPLEVRVVPMTARAGISHWHLKPTAEPTLEQSLAAMFNRASFGIAASERETGGRFCYVNDTLAAWLGMPAGELVSAGRCLEDFVAEPNGCDPASLMKSAGRSLMLVGAAGRRFPALITETPGAPGAPSVATVLDLGVLQESRDALRRSEQRFRRIFEDAPIGIALLDDTGRVAECNQAFGRLIGVDPSLLLGEPIGRYAHGDDHNGVMSRLRQTAGQAGQDGEADATLELRLAAAREATVQVYARRLAAEPNGWILHCIDISERKNLETQFVQSQKMQAIGQLAGGVAHDFNNLLTAMIGFCDLLLLRHKPGDRSFADIMQVKQNANRAANLVRQLLAFSRQQTLQARVLDITDVLTEITHLLRRLIGENIELEMVHGRDVGLVRVDLGQLEQVIINLAVNARDAMPNGGRLTIATRNLATVTPLHRQHEVVPPGDYVVVDVIDTGIGIPPENLQRIFEPFFSTKEVGAGTGLGLSTVYGIVRQTGGYVVVESVPGEGATFSVLLPRFRGETQAVEPAVAVETRELPVSDLTGSETILLVEDEDAVRVFSGRALRNKGYQVVEAKNGESALEQLAVLRGQIDLLITDVVMPEMDGPALIRRVRQQLPSLKVICISGYAEDRFRGDLAPGQAVHYLAKPFSLKQLASKVKEVLRGDVVR